MRSVQRALDILSLLTEDRPTVSIREIVEATGLAKTTVIRLVSTLEQSGLLWATSGGYMAGPGPVALGASGPAQLGAAARRPSGCMRELAARQRETVNVYVARDIYRVCIAQQESPQPLRHVVHVGDELPLWAGASAKVLLRDASAALLARIARSSPYGAGHVKRLREWIDEAAVAGLRGQPRRTRGRPVRRRRADPRPLRRGRRRARPQRSDRCASPRAGSPSSPPTSNGSPSTCPSAASTIRSARPT